MPETLQAKLTRRQRELESFLRQLADNANLMASQVLTQADAVHDATENADSEFEVGLNAIENFLRNLRMAHAGSLMARYATAETELLNS